MDTGLEGVMNKLLPAALLAAVSTMALAENVYYCTDAKSVGITWDKKNPQGGRDTTFNNNRYVMKIISKTKREVTHSTGDTKGTTHFLTCRVPWSDDPSLLTCTNDMFET